jgi:tRNA (adenine57-N1/adenine58-N1)-methyltransferase
MIFPDHDCIQEEDLIILFISPTNLSCHQVSAKVQVKTALGRFDLGNAIGKPFGVQFWDTTRTKRVALLKPTPDLWTRCLPHRTQILYFADIAFILNALYIRPGSIVLECGTGSGSMTHSLAKAVGSTGRVHSFEYHSERVLMARSEFERHGVLHSNINPMGWVTCEHRDVGLLGFPEGLNAMSVFLDLPNPWDVIPKIHLSVDRARAVRVCSYSPCIEQVLRSHQALRDNGFTEVHMFETLQQNLQVIDSNRNKSAKMGSSEGSSLTTLFMDEDRGHTSYLSFACLPANT